MKFKITTDYLIQHTGREGIDIVTGTSFWGHQFLNFRVARYLLEWILPNVVQIVQLSMYRVWCLV